MVTDTTTERSTITVYCPLDHAHLGDLTPRSGITSVTCPDCGTTYSATWKLAQYGLWSLTMNPPAQAVLTAPKDHTLWGLR